MVSIYSEDPHVATAYKMVGVILIDNAALGANDGAALVLGTADVKLEGTMLTDGLALNVTEGFTEGNALEADDGLIERRFDG